MAAAAAQPGRHRVGGGASGARVGGHRRARVWPHPYDRVHSEYVRVPASFEAYPRAETILPEFERQLARTRLDHGEPVLEGDTLTVDLQSDAEIDPRILRYFQRSDLFTGAVLDPGPDGTTGILTVQVDRLHFFFGTDAIGRDLVARTLIGVRISLAIGVLASLMALTWASPMGRCRAILAGGWTR
jgi:oligopeptide transport system permease protein